MIGKGRWTWPLGLLYDKDLTEKILRLGHDLQTDVKNLPEDRSTTNIQKLWQTFKIRISDEAKKAAKIQLTKIQNHISAIQREIKRSLKEDNIDSHLEDETRTHIIRLEAERTHLEKKRYKGAYLKAQAQWHVNGERINKYWSKVNTPKKPRDPIYKLTDPTTNQLTTKSSQMAEIAQDYHERLQSTGLLPPTAPERQLAQANVLQEIPNSQKFNAVNTDLHLPISNDQTRTALSTFKGGTATGLDGIPYEVWKHLNNTYLQSIKKKQPGFDITNCLTAVFNDIQTHGVDPTTDFSAGWMCPIYKKKDRTKIENYRPITLLNTNYKIMTKTLAMQLAQHISKLVHPNQSGFIPKRSIFDPIRLAKTMCDYADYMEEDGAIVALDQEKAYDKIDHQYLISTLEAFNLPQTFTNTVSHLYKHAHTTVAINGVLSSTYLVTRGVRQGDPLSCLLFDLAIEPLACSLRNSPKLHGFHIPGSLQKTLVNMYADDTTIYLSADDHYEDLESLLNQWCIASGAKFNLEKTEVIPIGTKAHRDRILTSRQIHPSDQPLCTGVHIAPDGHAVHCLGAWIGNGLDETTPWTPILDKINSALSVWSKSHPTLDGKRLIIQMVVAGMTQFLTKAQGMPEHVAASLTKTIRNFIWDNKKNPPISLARLQLPRSQGGIHLLNLQARNRAIDITWINTYLDLSPSHPMWAYTFDAIINCLRPSGIKCTKDLNAFLTSWSPPTKGPRTQTIPQVVANLLKSI